MSPTRQEWCAVLKMPEKKPIVSIVCITYNHEKYIADALDSFLMQELDYPFEIIVHDDASTDRTPEIIRQYVEKYPNYIVPILQETNKHSQGIKLRQFIEPFVKGKYVATCEGDDFWTDRHKLKRQVELMESHPDYIACYHKVAVVDTNKEITGRVLGIKTEISRLIHKEESAIGGTLHISSLMVLSQYYFNRPEWMSIAIHGDYALALYLSLEGNVYFINEIMSSYRTGVENSKMTKMRENYSIENEIKYLQNRTAVFEAADEYYNGVFHDVILSYTLIHQADIHLLLNDFSKSARGDYRNVIKQRGFIFFIKRVILKKLKLIAPILVWLKTLPNRIRLKGKESYD